MEIILAIIRSRREESKQGGGGGGKSNNNSNSGKLGDKTGSIIASLLSNKTEQNTIHRLPSCQTRKYIA